MAGVPACWSQLAWGDLGTCDVVVDRGGSAQWRLCLDWALMVIPTSGISSVRGHHCSSPSRATLGQQFGLRFSQCGDLFFPSVTDPHDINARAGICHGLEVKPCTGFRPTAIADLRTAGQRRWPGGYRHWHYWCCRREKNGRTRRMRPADIISTLSPEIVFAGRTEQYKRGLVKI